MTNQQSDIILDRMMALHPKIIDLTLDRMWRLLKALGNPQNDLPPVVHIAGTNGKGSTQAMIRAGLEANGHKVHAYTSPHLVRFHERIRLAGDLISEPNLSAILDECYAANGGTEITYFEITTCAALLAFARTPADYTLLEVGLGGRLDATNVVDQPAVSVITPVSIDHQQFLGETLGEIAFEKAGIIKRNVPVVIGPQDDTGLEVIEAQAERMRAPINAYGQHWHVGTEHNRLVFQDESGLLDLPMPNLLGEHQVQNAGIALATLRNLGVGEDACEAVVTQAQWPARMQKLIAGPIIEAAPNAQIFLDGGHNPAAAEVLSKTLAQLPQKPLYLVTGMQNTKDVTGYLKVLAKDAVKLFGVTIPNASATLTAEETVAAAHKVGLDAEVSNSVIEAVKDIAAQTPNARILICGSLYLAGAVLGDNQ